MKYKGAAFLQSSTNSDETFLRGLFAWSIVEPNRNVFGDQYQAHHAVECYATTQCFSQHSWHCG